MKLTRKMLGFVGVGCALMGAYICSFDYIIGLPFMLYGIFCMCKYKENNDDDKEREEGGD